MKVALVHYWLVNMRGGEKVLEALCELFPEADIFTHVYDGTAMSPVINAHNVYETDVGRLPFAKKFYKQYLPFMPRALEKLDLEGYDLVISSESGPAKGLVLPTETRHICYCHSPMRYLWDYYHRYMENSSPLVRAVFGRTAHKMRQWDASTGLRPDAFVANSVNVAARIKRIYRRDSEVIYPPVDVDKFRVDVKKGDYYLFFGQLVDYKRADLAIEAFKRSGRRLIVAGAGKIPSGLGHNIEFVGHVEEEEKIALLAGARALIFPGKEDFGIVPVEAIAAGTPVLAYARGGALETVKDGVSGLLFKEQTPEAINECVEAFEKRERFFDPRLLRMEAMKFDKSVFMRKMGSLARAEVKGKRSLF